MAHFTKVISNYLVRMLLVEIVFLRLCIEVTDWL